MLQLSPKLKRLGTHHRTTTWPTTPMNVRPWLTMTKTSCKSSTCPTIFHRAKLLHQCDQIPAAGLKPARIQGHLSSYWLELRRFADPVTLTKETSANPFSLFSWTIYRVQWGDLLPLPRKVSRRRGQWWRPPRWGWRGGRPERSMHGAAKCISMSPRFSIVVGQSLIVIFFFAMQVWCSDERRRWMAYTFYSCFLFW